MKFRNTIFVILGLAASFSLGLFINSFVEKGPGETETTQAPGDTVTTKPSELNNEKPSTMKLGVFSVSLSVKDLKASKQFYENLGFKAFDEDMSKNYLIMKNENALIGLFQGMFQGNILTFNPGWDENAKNIEKFDDVRVIQKHLKSKGVKLDSEANESTTGPASLMLKDPDGNLILIDQHR